MLSKDSRVIVEALRPDEEGVRWVKSHRFHVTLVFLGEIEKAAVPTHLDTVRAWRRHFPIATTEAVLSGFPSSDNARVVVLLLRPTDQFDALALTDKAFNPHLTLGYVRHGRVLVNERNVDLSVVFNDVGLYESKSGEYRRIVDD